MFRKMIAGIILVGSLLYLPESCKEVSARVHLAPKGNLPPSQEIGLPLSEEAMRNLRLLYSVFLHGKEIPLEREQVVADLRRLAGILGPTETMFAMDIIRELENPSSEESLPEEIIDRLNPFYRTFFPGKTIPGRSGVVMDLAGLINSPALDSTTRETLLEFINTLTITLIGEDKNIRGKYVLAPIEGMTKQDIVALDQMFRSQLKEGRYFLLGDSEEGPKLLLKIQERTNDFDDIEYLLLSEDGKVYLTYLIMHFRQRAINAVCINNGGSLSRFLMRLNPKKEKSFIVHIDYWPSGLPLIRAEQNTMTPEIAYLETQL